MWPSAFQWKWRCQGSRVEFIDEVDFCDFFVHRAPCPDGFLQKKPSDADIRCDAATMTRCKQNWRSTKPRFPSWLVTTCSSRTQGATETTAPSGARRQPRHLRTLLAAPASRPLASPAPQAGAPFCGFYAGKADASLFNEASQVVLVRDGERTVLDVERPFGAAQRIGAGGAHADRAAAGPGASRGETTFERLDAYSSPRLAEYTTATLPHELLVGPEHIHCAVLAPMAAAPGMRQLAPADWRDSRPHNAGGARGKQSAAEIWLRSENGCIPRGASAALEAP